MGSSTKRKPADRLRINRPAEVTTGTGGGAQQDINNVCPVTLRTKLSLQNLTPGIELLLEGNSLRLAADRSNEVGVVPVAILKTLETCLGLGINYPTIRVVIDKQGVCYAEFTQ